MLGDPQVIASYLEKAAALIERTGWTQRAYARLANGDNTSWRSPEAVCFCAAGALYRVTLLADYGTQLDAREALKKFLGTHIGEWNDQSDRTAGEVISTMNSAARSLRG